MEVNAKFILDISMEYGSAAKFFANWPDSEYVALLGILKKRCSHLGGAAAMRFLRAIGKPAFVTSPDMIAALIREGVIEKSPASKRDFERIQVAFNKWSEKSGRDLTEISRVLAMSTENKTDSPKVEGRDRLKRYR